jgi:transcriptional regulator with XRE-family HTH domain
MKINTKQIGKRIKNYRKKANLTQEQLAEYVNLSVQYIGYLENGKKGASLSTIIDIANTLGITVNPLLIDNIDCEIIAHICEFEELIIHRNFEERDAILDAAITKAEML